MEGNWFLRAINHPAGVLTKFWLQSLALWRRQREPQPDSLGDQYDPVFSKIAQDTTPVGILGKAVIASSLGFILAADENWAEQYLIPLFECEEGDDCQAVWDGFLYGGLNPQVADALKEAFLKAIPRIGDLFPDDGDVRRQFVTFFAGMVTYFVDEPLDIWIPKFFDNAETEDRRRFAWALGRELDGMDDGRLRDWWGRWVKRYWESRLQGIPTPLDAGEVKAMLDWLPYLDSLFPEAVDLAIQMPQTPLEHSPIIREISRGDLWSKHPDATAQLLVHIADSKSPAWAWHGGKELIDNLLALDLPDDLKTKLKELPARLGLSEDSP